MTDQEFLNKIKPDVIQDMHDSGILASLTAAQAFIESNKGGSKLSQEPNNNLFGIKGSYNGSYVTMKTKEYVNGKYIVVDAAFKKYPNWLASIKDMKISEASAIIKPLARMYKKTDTRPVRYMLIHSYG